MRRDMGLVGKIFGLVGFLLLALVGLSAYLWFTDYEAQAEVTDKGRDAEGDFIVITPNALPMDVKRTLTAEQANFVCLGYKVTYRIQTGHFQVFDQRDMLVYDSEEGLRNTSAALRCGASNQSGGILG